MKANQQRIRSHIEALAQFTKTPGEGVTRLTYSQEHMQARAYLKEEMAALGLDVREDAIGIIYGRLPGANPDKPAVIIGSHFDTVYNGGAFDGVAGVVAGLEIAAMLKEENCVLNYPVEVAAFIEEEGTRFPGGMLASRAAAGKVAPADFEQLYDSDGISMAQAMDELGFDHRNAAGVIREPNTLKAFLELHIEQGPILENTGTDIGIVEVIAGIKRIFITIQGQAGHSGTTPMPGRADALVAAAKAVLAAERFAKEVSDTAVATVGKLDVFPNGTNIIPERVVFTVDIRDKTNDNILRVFEKVKEFVNSLAVGGITTDIEEIVHIDPVKLCPEIYETFKIAADRLGYTNRYITSGAGHDAMIFAEITDTAMVFVPSRKGLSHCPEEWTDYGQIAKGVAVVYETLKKITEE